MNALRPSNINTIVTPNASKQSSRVDFASSRVLVGTYNRTLTRQHKNRYVVFYDAGESRTAGVNRREDLPCNRRETPNIINHCILNAETDV